MNRGRAGVAPARCLAVLLFLAGAGEAAATSYAGRPIYSEPSIGLQLPPGCEVEPSWRSQIPGGDLEAWIARCEGTTRVWLLRRQVLEVVAAHPTRLRFQVLDERALPGEDAGDTASVQCTGPRDEPGFVVLGAKWRAEGRQLRLRSARAVLRAEPRTQSLVDADVGQVDCIRFPDREAMMKRLQQDGRKGP